MKQFKHLSRELPYPTTSEAGKAQVNKREVKYLLQTALVGENRTMARLQVWLDGELIGVLDMLAPKVFSYTALVEYLTGRAIALAAAYTLYENGNDPLRKGSPQN